MPVCDTALPALTDLGEERCVRCFLYQSIAEVPHASRPRTAVDGGGVP
jgi:hypothetical protein